MAKIGLSDFKYAVFSNEDTTTAGTPIYQSEGVSPGRAISCSVSITSNDAKLYADDALAESDKSFQSGTVTIGIDEDDIQTMGTLLGHEVKVGNDPASTYTLIRKANDIAPYVGLGRIITKMVNGVYKYKVEFLYKVKFSEPKADNSTRGESTEFGTYELEGSIATLSDGKWSVAQLFDTKAAAQTYLASLFQTT